MFNNPTGDFELGEAAERYAIIRTYSYGKNLNVYKAYEVDNQKAHYVIKSYKTEDTFERESQMLKKLIGSKNIMQMIDFYPAKTIIVCECALFDLETFLGHQDNIQRHKEKGDVIKDVVSGLLELQKHDIVHTELAPKNIMYFQEKDGYTENWKLIDFDTACIAGSDHVKITMNYSAPEVIRAREKNVEIKAEFAMDMFSFGLILYFLETGHHYWDGENEEVKQEIISNKYLQLRDIIRDSKACYAINKLLSKDASNRMTLEIFTQTLYYTGESKHGSNGNNNSTRNSHNSIFNEEESDARSGMNEIELRLYTQEFLEKYHNEMKQSLKIMGDKIDDCTRAVNDLSELTKKIPQWLVKLKNEKVPRIFVMIPDRKDWKKPATLLFSKPFRLLFVCQHKDQWHVPEQEGYQVLEVPQFIKKYGPWINLCLQALSGVMKMATSNIFPQGIADVLSSVFNINSNFNPDLMKYFQEIIDTVDIGVNTIVDENPDFIPLSRETNSRYQMINDSGLRELKKFLDTQECADHLGGLIPCVDDETQEILWLCEKHRKVTLNTPPLTPLPITPPPLTPPPLTPPYSSSPSSSMGIFPFEPFPKWDYNKFDTKNLTSQLDPFFALDCLYKILGEVVKNAIASERKHFRNDDIKKITHEVDGYMKYFKSVCLNWDNNDQRVQFIGIIKNQIHLYIHFLMLIVRYYAAVSTASLAKKISILYCDMIEINSIIKAGKSFNKHLSKLIATLERDSRDSKMVQSELDNFANKSNLNVKIDSDSTIVNYKDLSQWYHVVDRTYIDNLVSPIETQGGGVLFKVTKQILDNCTIVTGKSLEYPNNNNNYLCVMKEIYLYNERRLNDNDYIIEFRGYSVHNCKCTLFYDYADYGDLFKYFKVNHNSSGNLLKSWEDKIKLAWKISQGVKYLHDKYIVHLDLRSANILLKYDEVEKTIIPKISNFLWSNYLFGKTSVYPKTTISSEKPVEEIWKRWHDPDRLLRIRNFEPLLPPSDIYSLGLLFWEIAWCKADNLPFKDVPIKKLYDHLRNDNYETLPRMPEEYQRWERLISKMWQFRSDDRYNIMTVESTMQKL